MALTDKLTAIANAIRGKTGKTDALTLDQMPGEIAGIQTGGGDLDGLLDGSVTEITSNVGKLRQNGLRDATTVKSLSLPLATILGSNCCYGCKGLESVSIPSALRLEGNCFQNCTALTEISVPSATYFSNSNFTGCTKLKKADFGVSVPSVMAATFNGCTVFDCLVLRNTKLVTLANVNAFGSTPFASGGTGGTVYVSSSLIESYKAATNWATLYTAGTCNFVAIEGSEYE
jgi:hypothetical protein